MNNERVYLGIDAVGNEYLGFSDDAGKKYCSFGITNKQEPALRFTDDDRNLP